MEFEELRQAIEEVMMVDAHAHNIVALDSSFPFINAFSEAAGEALSFAPHSLSFKVSLFLYISVLVGLVSWFVFICLTTC